MSSQAAAAGRNWKARWLHLADMLTRVHSAVDEQQLLKQLDRPQAPIILGFVNAHAMNAAATSEQFFHAIGSADVLLRDGSGMAFLLRLLKHPPGINLNGTDLIPKILASHAGEALALFGTCDPYLARAEIVVTTRLAPASPCVTADGFLDAQSYIHLAIKHKPSVIVLGMGMPKQEQIALELRSAIPFGCLIICGGAILDFLGDKVTRAPKWMRNAGIEWTFRLAKEPRRLFKRYVLGNPVFMARALQLAVTSDAHMPS